ncbi:MAG: hypothetical protein QM642_11185 [Edaphocola sp.]
MEDNINVLRGQLVDFINKAQEDKVRALYNLCLVENYETAWWQNPTIVSEMEERYAVLESAEDKGVSLSELKNEVEQKRKKRYNKDSEK